MVNSNQNSGLVFARYTLIVFLLLLPGLTWAATCTRDEGAPAIPACRQALQENPHNVDVLVQYADILLDLGRPEEAVQLLEDSYGKTPTDSTIRLKLSIAREATQRPVEDSGPSSRTLQRLSVLRCKTRTGQAALDDCEKALKRQPLDAELLLAKGNALMQLGRPAEALCAYELALIQDRTNSEAQGKVDLAAAEIPGKKKATCFD